MTVISFSELKAQHDGILTPKVILENVLANVDTVKDVVVFIRRTDERITYGNSNMSAVEAVGICELSKTLIINNLWEDR